MYVQLFTQFKTLLSISRPRFWLYLAGPFIVGYTAGAYSFYQLFSPIMYVWWFYFFFFANIFIYGVNDLEDRDTDEHNDKKGNQEHLLVDSEEWLVVIAVVVSAIVGLLLALTLGRILILLWMLLFLFLGYGYSARPLRFKARPLIDFLSNVLYLVPGFIGYALVSGAFPDWWIVIAGSAWVGAMHVYSAIPDIAADRMAKLITTPVLIGRTASFVLCFVLWITAAVLTSVYGTALGWGRFLLWIYPAILLFSFIKKNEQRVYWYFPMINGVIGTVLFVLLLMRIKL